MFLLPSLLLGSPWPPQPLGASQEPPNKALPPHPLSAGIAIEYWVRENGRDAGAVGIRDFETKRFVSLREGASAGHQ